MLNILPSFSSLHPWKHDGSPAALLESSPKIRPGFSLLPRLLKPARSDPEIRPQYVPPMFSSVREGYRFHQVGLSDLPRHLPDYGSNASSLYIK